MHSFKPSIAAKTEARDMGLVMPGTRTGDSILRLDSGQISDTM
jgi:hypothetical protein